MTTAIIESAPVAGLGLATMTVIVIARSPIRMLLCVKPAYASSTVTQRYLCSVLSVMTVLAFLRS